MTTAVAKIGTQDNLKNMLGKMTEQMAHVLPQHVTPERMVKLAMVAAHRNPGILKCTKISVMEAVMRASELGLDCSGTRGDAYIVPYGDQATMIIGYRGLAVLARQSGEVKRIETNIVCDNDDFTFEEGTDFRLVFRRSMGDRGMAVGAYALAELKDGTFQAEYMTYNEIEAIREGSVSRNSPAWKNHWGEMARKTVFRRLSKWLPTSNEKFRAAVEYDDQTTGYVVSEQSPRRLESASLSDALDQASSPIDEQPDQPAIENKLAATWADAVNLLIEKAGCDSDTAEEVIGDAVNEKYKKDPSELTEKQVEAVIKAVSDGKIAVPE